jgi:putative membrane protein
MTDQTAQARTPLDDPGTNLSSNRTSLSLDRTAMSAQRTLMAVMRTALSLISFGFTIYQFISKFTDQKPQAASAARNFGISLIVLGIGCLMVGLVDQFRTMSNLRSRRDGLYAAGPLRHGSRLAPTPIGIVAFLLLLIGLIAIAGMALRTGPFG